jgi:hypothetical protein
MGGVSDGIEKDKEERHSCGRIKLARWEYWMYDLFRCSPSLQHMIGLGKNWYYERVFEIAQKAKTESRSSPMLSKASTLGEGINTTLRSFALSGH